MASEEDPAGKYVTRESASLENLLFIALGMIATVALLIHIYLVIVG